MAQYKRILLKLSGESLMGGKQYGIDEVRLNEYAALLSDYLTDFFEQRGQSGVCFSHDRRVCRNACNRKISYKLFDCYGVCTVNIVLHFSFLSKQGAARRTYSVRVLPAPFMIIFYKFLTYNMIPHLPLKVKVLRGALR